MTMMTNFVELVGQKYLKTYGNFMSMTQNELLQKQEKNFKRLKSNLKNTRIYKDFKLEHINSYEDYIAHVPSYEYSQYAPYSDMLATGHQNILFNDQILYFGLTSGTSGKDSKRIPYNTEMLNMFIKAQTRIVSRLSVLEPKINFLEAKRLTFGSDPHLYTQNNIKYGYVSGILSTKIPKSLKKKTFPSTEVLAVSDWDQKISMLMDECLSQDIKVVSGIPTYIISIFESILEKTGKKNINEVWPNLSVFIYAATPIKQYQDRINSLVGHPMNYYGVYAATEGVIGIPYSKFQNGVQEYLLNPDLLYSFTPVDHPDHNLGLHQIEEGVHYHINIGAPNGLIHYSMKDVVVFKHVDLSSEELIFEFVGRKSTGMNLAAEKVSDEQILNSYLALKNEFNLDLKHFFLSPGSVDNKTVYHWTLFASDLTEENVLSYEKFLDQKLSELNLDYKDCREVGVIGAPVVKLVSAETLKKYFDANKSRGQFKMKTTFETLEDYLSFMNSQILETV